MRPKKSLGQYFLKNHLAIKKIVESLFLQPGEFVLEIGPGQGVLTLALLETGAQVVAVEKDEVLAEALKNRLAGFKNFEILPLDILDFLPKFVSGEYKLCGNLPYYLTGKILELSLEVWPRPSKIVFLVQKEVAERICAKPPRMSVLAVISQLLAKPSKILFVPRQDFYPAPKVDSAVVLFETFEKNIFLEQPELKNLIKGGFAHPRKLLLSNFSEKFNLPKEILVQIFQKNSLSLNVRPGELSPQHWQDLCGDLFPEKH